MFPAPNAERHQQLIAKYYVPNMGDYSTVGSDLSLILERLDVNHVLAAEDKKYLRDKGLFDLCKFVDALETTGVADFGILRAPFERQAKQAAYRNLRNKYDIEYVEPADRRHLTDLVFRLENGSRLSDDDVLWLTEHDYFSPALRFQYHGREGEHYRQRFEQGHDPWDAVNGSSHYRKAQQAPQALGLVEQVDSNAESNKHLRSALGTTRGGALRDLGRYEEALQSAIGAHELEPASFHPCTLLGAIHYELGNHVTGDEWFAKAVARGASMSGVDAELRAIFMRCHGVKREAMKRHLLRLNPARYAWVNQSTATRRTTKPPRVSRQ